MCQRMIFMLKREKRGKQYYNDYNYNDTNNNNNN